MAAWDGGALVLESTAAFGDGESWTTLSNLEFTAEEWGEHFEGVGDEENVGQWLSNIGQGAATGAATGAVAGPWGALIGGLVGGGLGAAQTAMAQQQPATPRPAPPPRPAPAPRPPPPAPRPAAAAPRRPTVPIPLPRQTAPAPPTVPGEFRQLLDQLASLVPVIAALAVQVGHLTQGSTAGPAAVGDIVTVTEAQLSGFPAYEAEAGSPEHTEDLTGWGESAEGLDEAAWVEGDSGEWLAAEDRDVDLEGAETEEEPWTEQ